MLYTPVMRRSVFGSEIAPTLRALDRNFERSFERWLGAASAGQAYRLAQDDKAYTLSLDLPGIAKEQLSIGIEGSVVRLATLPDAPRSFKAAYELPQEIDVANSQAKLEHGVLTLTLVKTVAQSKEQALAIH